jgi:hypothetical protein
MERGLAASGCLGQCIDVVELQGSGQLEPGSTYKTANASAKALKAALVPSKESGRGKNGSRNNPASFGRRVLEHDSATHVNQQS